MRTRHHHLKHNALALAAAAVLGPLAATPASAATCTWNTAAGNWAALANWAACVAGNGNPAGVPGSSDTATIGAAGVVTINTGQSVLNLNNAGQINIDAFGLNLVGGGSTANTGVINVGGASTANLGVSAGHNINNAGGVINVGNGSVINQFGSTISGGTINTTGTGALVAFGSGSNFLSGVTLNGLLDMASGFGIERVINGLTLGGTISVNNNSVLAFEGNNTVSGGGTIVLGNTGGSNRISLDGTGTTTFAAGTTIRGENGSIIAGTFVGGTQALVNNGTISADVAGGTISINAAPVTNNGTLSALNGGTLVLNNSVSGGATGQIVAGVGSTVLQNGVALSGTINTSGSGRFAASASGSNFLNGVTLNGSLDLASGTAFERVIGGGLVLNGSVNLNNNSVLAFEGNGGLSGNGTIVLGNTGGSNRISLDGTGTTTFAAGTTIRGENGSITAGTFVGGTQALVNNGTISADVSGGTISINTAPVTNNGTLSALNGGTLVLNNSVSGGATGQIVAGVGSTVLQNGVALSGTINTSGSGTFTANGSGSNFLSGVTFNGNLDLTNGGFERVTAGGVVLNGTININNNGILAFNDTGGLSGNATLVLGNTGGSNRIGLDGTGTTTFASGTTIRGHSGTIGAAAFVGGSQALVNNGTISADVSGGTITINTVPVTNNGTLSALNGGTLVLSSNVTGNLGGQIVAGAGSTVLQNGVTLSGTINTSGSGTFTANGSGSNFLSGVTLNGNLDLTNGGFERVTAGGLVLNGTVNINSNGVFVFNDTGGLSGNATLVLGNTGGSNRIGLDGTGTTTFAAGTTIRGENGTIGNAVFVGGSQVLVNNGTISADVASGTISLVAAPVTNNGVLSALNGGTLVLSSNVTGNPGGQIVAGAGSTVLQNGVTLSGTINTSGSGTFTANGSGSNFLSGVTLNGNLDLTNGGFERVTAGGLVLNGTVNINSNGVFVFNDTGGLSGNATLVLGNTGGSNRIGLDGTGTTSFASGTTIRGHSGTIGNAVFVGGSQTLVNNGSIIAELTGGTINIAGAPLVNNGLVRAQAGTMNVNVPLSGTGTLQVDATGAMNLAAGAKSQGVLAMGATGAALNLNTGNLTISSDYTNVGAGTGNSFNRRAGVTGTGQIVAAANAAQVINGLGVANGATSNATLTIGNMRVGANTFNYQIGNSGTTGPTLRGAIQTSVNGGNLSDARLSGAGVTASNYNAGAPGGNSGNLGVTFTAAGAGALAPLTGQAINLRSNFDNIADQRLNIVLANGATAYNRAVGSAAPAPVNLANQRVNGTLAQALTVSNTAAAGAFSEDLNASFGANTGAATNNAANIAGVVAGGSNIGSMGVGVNTTSSGAKTGTVTLNYQTNGTVGGISNGLGVAGANAPQVINVNGNVYQAASGSLQTGPLNFGTVQVGQTINQSLVVRNTATGAAGFVEDLHAAFGASGNGQITGSGGLSGIAAGSNSTGANGTMTVTVNATTAGALNSGIAVNYTSAGAVGGVSNGLGTLAVGSENYAVSGTIQAVGNVINQANALVNNPTINLGAVRVGAAAPSGTVSVTNVASAPPQAALNASIAATSGPATAGGSFSGLVPGATNNGSLLVGLNTGTAGNFTGGNAGTATISFVSDASNVGNCAPNCQLSLASQVVNVAGKVYTQAVGQLATGAVNFGVVRVGDTVSARNITINNTAASTALNDTLRADLTGLAGPLSGNGSVSGIAAQASGQLAVGLSTVNAGVFSQTGSVGFTSHNADMADTSAGAAAALSVFAQVNNLANGDFDLVSGQGTLSQTGTSYVLDLGTVVLGSSVSSLLQLDNDVAGPADELSGQFDLTAADDFTLGGWNPLAFLTAGQASGALSVNWLAGALGLFSDTIVFNGRGTNASDPTGLAQSRQLLIRANVIQNGGGGNVPEPGTLWLLLGAAAAGLLARRRAAARLGGR